MPLPHSNKKKNPPASWTLNNPSRGTREQTMYEDFFITSYFFMESHELNCTKKKQQKYPYHGQQKNIIPSFWADCLFVQSFRIKCAPAKGNIK